jgi:vacuolar iron transporter family protein
MSIREEASYIRDIIFGSADGTISIFAIIAGSVGGGLASRSILILGFAALLADGIAMASGSYLGIKSEGEYENSHGYRGRFKESPVFHSFITFISFSMSGLLLLIPFLFNIQNEYQISFLIMILSLFMVGGIKSSYTKKNFFKSGFEMLVIGGFAALVAFFTGYLLDKYIG